MNKPISNLQNMPSIIPNAPQNIKHPSKIVQNQQIIPKGKGNEKPRWDLNISSPIKDTLNSMNPQNPESDIITIDDGSSNTIQPTLEEIPEENNSPENILNWDNLDSKSEQDEEMNEESESSEKDEEVEEKEDAKEQILNYKGTIPVEIISESDSEPE